MEATKEKAEYDIYHLIARLALGLIIFLVMRYAPRAVEAWQKRKDMKGEMR